MTALAPKLSSLVPALPGSGAVLSVAVPSLVERAGEAAALHTAEFFVARVPNPNTRAAYARAVTDFCDWCAERALPLPALSSPLVAAYFQALSERFSAATANQHLSAVRQWLHWLALRGVLPANPAACVRGLRLSRQEGKTPVLEREQARRLFASLESATDIVGQRDRAIFSVMLYGLVRVSAVVRLQIRDFQDQGDRAWLVLREKGGKQRRIPAHHLIRESVRSYLVAGGLGPELTRDPLFQSAPGTGKALSGRPLDRSSVLAMVKRRCHAAGLPASICNHSLRATGITIHQENGGDIESAAQLAGHSDPRTTQLYNRARRMTAHLEVERIQL